MKRYTKKIDGRDVVRYLKSIVIRKDGKVTYNPSEEKVLDDGWVEYVQPVLPEPTGAELLEKVKERKLRSLKIFDESEDVNDCVIIHQGQTIHYWAKPSDRNDLKAAARDFISTGLDIYRLDLRDKSVSIPVKCDTLLQMLAALEVYAVRCFNVTTDHEFKIKDLKTVEEVEAYDFSIGYPEKLTFEL